MSPPATDHDEKAEAQSPGGGSGLGAVVAKAGAASSPLLFAAVTGAAMLLQGRNARAALGLQAEEGERARDFARWQQADNQAFQERLLERQAAAAVAQHGAIKEIEQAAASWPLENPPRHVLAEVESGRDGIGGRLPLLAMYAPSRESADPAFTHAFEAAVRNFVDGPLRGAEGGVLALDGWRAGRGFNSMAASALRRGLPDTPFVVLSLCTHPGGRAELLAAYEDGHASGPCTVRALGSGTIALRDAVADAGRIDVEWRERARAHLAARGVPDAALSALFGQGSVEEGTAVDLERALAADGFPVERLGLARRLATPERYMELAPAALTPLLQMVLGFFVDGHRLLRGGHSPRGIAEMPRLAEGLAPALAPNVDHLLGAYDRLLSMSGCDAATSVPARLRLARAAVTTRGRERGRAFVEAALADWLGARGRAFRGLQGAPETVAEVAAVADDAAIVELFALLIPLVGGPSAHALRGLADRLRAGRR